ncbi:MAG: hypothetical protein ABIG30_02430 [Candidatus Aenigmatarchaeota archaeon]
MIEIDFIVAVAVFITIFMIVVGAANNYFSLSTENMEILSLRDDTNHILGLLHSIDSDFSLSTTAYRIDVVANGKKTSNNELAVFDVSKYNADYNSFSLYDPETRSSMILAGSTTKIFSYSIKNGETKRFYVYFDDDSSFSSHAVSYTGDDKIEEMVYSAVPVRIVQYNKISSLLSMNYEQLKSRLNVRDFHIKLDAFEYGATVPVEGDIVSIAMPVLYQKENAGLGFAQLTVSVW